MLKVTCFTNRAIDGSRQLSHPTFLPFMLCQKFSNFPSPSFTTFPVGNKTTQRQNRQMYWWMKATRRPGEDSGSLLWADTSWWDDRVLAALLYTLIIKRCLEGTLSKRLMRSCLTGNKSDLAEVRGRASHSHGTQRWKICKCVWVG